MESTALINAITELRESIGTPMSHMELIRHVLQKEVSRKGMPELQMLLTEDERILLGSNLEKVQAFMETEDGADAWELLVHSFRAHCEQVE